MKSFSITHLEEGHKKSQFSCAIESLDRYLHKQAGQDTRKKVAVTYVLSNEENSEVMAYYTLSSTALELQSLPESISKKLPNYPFVPATLLGRLAVDIKYKKQGLGELILVDALKRAKKISLEIASFAVVVDAINESAKSFYKKYGFLNLSNLKNRLYIPISTISIDDVE